MERPSRRSFLTGSAVAAAGLAGITGGSYAEQFDGLDADLPDSVAGALALLPSESAADTDYRTVLLADVADAEGEDEYGYEVREVLRSFDDLDVGDVSHVAAARVAEHSGQIGVVVGSFDRLEPGEKTDERGDWRFAKATDRAYATTEGRAVVVHSEEPADLATAAVDVDTDDAATFLDGYEDAGVAFELLADQPLVYFVPDVDQAVFSGIGSDTLDAFAAGFADDPNAIDGTVENQYLLFPATGTDLDDETVERIVTELEPGVVAEIDVDHTPDLVHTTVVAEEPPERDREAAPDAQIDAELDHDESAVVFRHREGEPIDADTLELWHDGERSDEGPSAEFDVFEAGDELPVATDPIATVTLRWFDEDENAFYTYDSLLVGQDAFEVNYDFDAERLEIEYAGDREADPTKLNLRNYSDNRTETLEGFAGEYDALAAGDAITVENVGVGDRVSLELDVPNEPRDQPRQLVSHRVRPPRVFLHRRSDTGVVARYHDEQERDAAEFRLLVDGREAETQFADLVDTLERGDDLELGDYDVGTELLVEWTAPAEPMEVGDLVVRPDTRVAAEYDGEEGTLTFVHDDGEAVDAADLELRAAGERTDVQPGDEDDRFEPGDELTVEAEPFVNVALSWVPEDVDSEYTLSRTVTAADTFEADYDPDADEVELTYVGTRQADPARLGVRRRVPGSGDIDGPEPLFAEAHDTLTTDDAITLTDVEIDERINVVLNDSDGRHRRHFFDFTPEPRFAFSFESRAGNVVAVYHDEVSRAGAAFRVLANGDATDVQPADEHDTLEDGDVVDLGEFETGTELVVEWTVPDDPVEVTDHVIAPDADFEIVYDDENGTLTATHDGGDELAAADVRLHIRPARSEPIAWGDDGTIEEGDSRAVELETDPEAVFLVFRERELLDDEQFHD
ncbi:twin-arginine translocation signal domain-containing protein [Natronorubrum halophilum]|uniref:twin-arginine translocation signal domain-containing protein n=1 Tax=Natronorubrum halophilum TaxID=1702106 RepID=UPI000EF726D3|nr:twin-arginine translocation signal domain-containing protein [Natronorubrum halophilum]